MLTRSSLEVLDISFRKFTTVMALGYSQNIVSAQYLVNEWMEFDQMFHTLQIKPVPR